MATLIIKPNKHFNTSLKELWVYRELFYFLAWRDVKVRYKQTLIGVMWALLQPLLTMVVFSFFFSKSFGRSIGSIPYPVFSYVGLLFWNYFSTSLTSISLSFFSNKTIITKVFFPRIIIPISSAFVPVVDFFFAFLLLIPLLLLFHIIPSFLALIMLLVCLFLSFFISIGLGLGLAIINVKYRDVQYAVPFFIQLLLFVTPVIYPVTVLPQRYQLLLYLNPMTSVIELARSVVFNTAAVSSSGLLISLLITILFFGVSLFVFRRYEAYIADIV